MSIETITIIMITSLLILMATGLPIAICIFAVCIFSAFIWLGPSSLQLLGSVSYAMITKDYLIALPMFIFMATVLQISGLGTALYDMMYKWLGGLKGGLAIGTVGASTILAAITGSPSTATVGMGIIAYPEMRDRGYNKTISIGCIIAGGSLGPLIPPSISMIIIAALAYISIGKLFIAGIFPGLLTSFLFMLYIGIRCFRKPHLGPSIPVEQRANWHEKFISLRGAILPILLIFLVLGLIYTGVSTPSEAGGIGAFGAIVCAAIYRNLTFENFKGAMSNALRINAMVFFMIISGVCFSSVLNVLGVSQFIANYLTGIIASQWIIFSIMMLITIVMGMFIDATPITIICIPIFLPIVRALGFDLLWFALIFKMVLLIGYFTPPFGMGMFYFKGIGHPDVTMADLYRAIVPFVTIFTISTILCIIFPQIPLWLPSMMIK